MELGSLLGRSCSELLTNNIIVSGCLSGELSLQYELWIKLVRLGHFSQPPYFLSQVRILLCDHTHTHTHTEREREREIYGQL